MEHPVRPVIFGSQMRRAVYSRGREERNQSGERVTPRAGTGSSHLFVQLLTHGAAFALR
jgi:hypothetical protein